MFPALLNGEAHETTAHSSHSRERDKATEPGEAGGMRPVSQE